MKKMIILLVIALLLVAVPVAAKTKDTVGEQFDISEGFPTEYAAETPFHIRNGWGAWSPDDAPIGIYDFQLDVDGVFIEEDFVDRYVDSSEKPTMHWLEWVFNFPDGLSAGTHTFTGHWFAPCRVVQEYGYPVTCPLPNYKLEVYTIPLEVTFSPTP